MLCIATRELQRSGHFWMLGKLRECLVARKELKITLADHFLQQNIQLSIRFETSLAKEFLLAYFDEAIVTRSTKRDEDVLDYLCSPHLPGFEDLLSY